MQLQQDGTPVISTADDQRKAERFIDKLLAKVYDRLPRVVKLFISREKLAEYLRGAIIDLASGL